MTNTITDDTLLDGWYRYVAQSDGFVGNWLQLLRERQKTTLEKQQIEFGVSGQDFVRLQGMPLPRPNQFTRDASRIALVCHLSNPSGFVQALLLARSLGRNKLTSDTSSAQVAIQFSAQQSYQAAFDADEDMDEPPDEG